MLKTSPHLTKYDQIFEGYPFLPIENKITKVKIQRCQASYNEWINYEATTDILYSINNETLK